MEVDGRKVTKRNGSLSKYLFNSTATRHNCKWDTLEVNATVAHVQREQCAAPQTCRPLIPPDGSDQTGLVSVYSQAAAVLQSTLVFWFLCPSLDLHFDRHDKSCGMFMEPRGCFLTECSHRGRTPHKSTRQDGLRKQSTYASLSGTVLSPSPSPLLMARCVPWASISQKTTEISGINTQPMSSRDCATGHWWKSFLLPVLRVIRDAFISRLPICRESKRKNDGEFWIMTFPFPRKRQMRAQRELQQHLQQHHYPSFLQHILSRRHRSERRWGFLSQATRNQGNDEHSFNCNFLLPFQIISKASPVCFSRKWKASSKLPTGSTDLLRYIVLFVTLSNGSITLCRRPRCSRVERRRMWTLRSAVVACCIYVWNNISSLSDETRVSPKLFSFYRGAVK